MSETQHPGAGHHSHAYLEQPRHCAACGARLEPRTVKAGEPVRQVCPSCGRIHYLDPKVAACVVPERDGQVLLLQRGIPPARGKWVMPGGFVDRGETPEEAARRECLEEVGLRVELGELLGIYGGRNGPIVIVYESRSVRGEAEPLDETLAIRWVDGSSLPWSDLAFPSTRESLTDLAERRGWPGPPKGEGGVP